MGSAIPAPQSIVFTSVFYRLLRKLIYSSDLGGDRATGKHHELFSRNARATKKHIVSRFVG
jgi:hypothetical protein